MPNILIVEDDQTIHQLLIDILNTNTNYHYVSTYSGTEALLQLEQQTFDLILLDLMLPGMGGEEVLEKSTAFHYGGIIVLSAKSELEDKVELLKLGADDYITKPFHKEELLARIESVLRRYKQNHSENKSSDIESLNYRQITLYPNQYQAYFGEEKIELTSTEFKLLQVLIESPHEVFTREKLYQQIWETDTFIEDNAINVHISNLRKKIAAFDDSTPYIETVWGIGFKMN
jgi:DNA-binding response OmpR family regulator